MLSLPIAHNSPLFFPLDVRGLELQRGLLREWIAESISVQLSVGGLGVSKWSIEGFTV